jgi:4-amino-4-deoxy-L-arabinose transferase-like glycosyltransferase
VTDTDSNKTSPAPASAPANAATFFDRLSERQMTLLVIAVGLLLYIPLAGTYGLWDPWETHYSEVARQMTKRGDFISLWWPGSPRDADVFWSKPVLTFWLMSIGMHVARIGLPGNPPGEMALLSRTEWAVRVPFCLMGVLAMWAIYMVVARFVSRRAGFLSALVMATSPMFSLIARQAMTDMAFVGPMTMALALGAIALLDDRDEVLPRRGRGWLSYPHHPAFFTTVAVFLVLVLPQLIIDSVQLKVKIPLGNREIIMYGAVAMIPYYLGSLLFLWFAMRARYRAPLYLYIAAMLCGVAVLAKGLAGAGLPIIIFCAYLIFTWNWKRLRRAQLLPAVIVSALVMVIVAAPWHHSMIIRHGWAFWNELFGDNHWRRMMLGRHGDRGSFEYFLKELGYGILPWVALAPAALTAIIMRKADDARKQAIYWLGGIWFVAGYALVSLSMTKFHHYVLPAIPGLAIVIGCFLDDLLVRNDARRAWLAALIGVPLLGVIFADLVETRHSAEKFLWLFSYDYVHSPTGRPWPAELDFRTGLSVLAILIALATLAMAWRKLLRYAVVGLCLVAVASTYYLLDVYMRDVAPFWSQKGTLAEYYRHRKSPDEKLIAYTMYWRGETFYSENEIYEGPKEERTVFDQDGADEQMKDWINNHRGRRVFIIYERGRQAHVQQLFPAETRATFKVLYEKNNKFSLAEAQI